MRTHLLSRWLCGAAAAGAISGLSPAASADGGMALDRFDPAPAGDRMFGVESPFVAGHLTPHVSVLADYAHNPLVVIKLSDRNDVAAVVSNQLFLHVNASLALWNRVNVNFNLPVAVFQKGESPSLGPAGRTLLSPSSAQLGDLRLGLRVRLFGDYFSPFQLAVGGSLWLPTGKNEVGSFVGDGKPRGLPQLILGGRTDRLVWSAAFGPHLRKAQYFAGVPQGVMFQGGAGLGVLLGSERQLQIGPEATFATVLRESSRETFNAEVLLDVRYRFLHDFEAGIGAGPGLFRGLGTPDFRGVAMISYTPEVRKDRDRDGILDANDACPNVPGVSDPDPKKNGCPLPQDRDRDGILDNDDACPDEPGVADADPKKNGCPLSDRDKDNIPDARDACPDEKGPADPDPKKNGCPPDRDADGILDAEDACPDIPGIRTSDPATNGCPGDRDGDGIRDDKDACPDEKGPRSSDPQKNGCPKGVRVTETEIIILQQVQFDTARATIKTVSDELLDEVASVLKDHPELLRLEVQGHTDNVGLAKQNQKLSQDRAEAVVKALVKRGVEPIRLTAKGYGQTVPVADNKTEEGRHQNRRVQFKVLDRRPKAAPRRP